MKDNIEWFGGWITIVIKITDVSFDYSYSKRREELRHKCRDHTEIIGEVVFSDHKGLRKGEAVKISSFVDHDDEIKELDDKMMIRDDKRGFRALTVREYREETDRFKCVGYISKNHKFLDTDDRFWERYTTIKVLQKDAYLSLSCKREKRLQPRVLSYSLESKFNPADYE